MKESGGSDSGGRSMMRGTQSPRRRAARVLRTGPGGEFERWVRGNSVAIGFLGLTLGVFLSRKFFILPIAVSASLLQEALHGALGRKTK